MNTPIVNALKNLVLPIEGETAEYKFNDEFELLFENFLKKSNEEDKDKEIGLPMIYNGIINMLNERHIEDGEINFNPSKVLNTNKELDVKYVDIAEVEYINIESEKPIDMKKAFKMDKLDKEKLIDIERPSKIEETLEIEKIYKLEKNIDLGVKAVKDKDFMVGEDSIATLGALDFDKIKAHKLESFKEIDKLILENETEDKGQSEKPIISIKNVIDEKVSNNINSVKKTNDSRKFDLQQDGAEKFSVFDERKGFETIIGGKKTRLIVEDKKSEFPIQRLDMPEGVSAKTEMTNMQETKIIEVVESKIIQNINFIKHKSNEEFEIRLRPEFLGRITIRLEKSEDGIKAKIVTSNLEVKEALSNNSTQITQHLKSLGVELQNTEVVYMGFTNQDSNFKNGDRHKTRKSLTHAKSEYEKGIISTSLEIQNQEVNLNGSLNYLV